ncbi:hypothetical protein RFI_11252 [Reticulomyxa filosa]|uniref:Uncharacterized protein n=1 Tax=Reticulomyxa filosa TaxID=46433 RepID=X6NKL9_RETFI|nr:hypothetical protein RFI_11252 [Reticulomyxa filosa]|eukprot:ETO25887.1 hypothetical protein RFI_11252 [Reticulomyxa filosa]
MIATPLRHWAKKQKSVGTSACSLLNGLKHTSISKRSYVFKGVYLFPGPGEIDLDDGATKPAGVPETWTTLDIGWPNSDFGYFDEDTFPPAKEGETLEEYCRRVPNIWSPCSKSTDVVDCMAYMDLWAANDPGPSVLGMAERPLIKQPPFVSNWHVQYVPDYEAMVSRIKIFFFVQFELCTFGKKKLREMMFRTRPFPIKVKEDEFKTMLAEFERGIKEKGIAHHFKARSFHDFWEELTGKPLKAIADVPTWEEEIDKRIAQAKENAK